MAIAEATSGATSKEDSIVKTPLHVLSAFAVAVVLSGCMGQQLTTGEKPRDNFIETGEVQVVPITPELLTANASAMQPAQVPAELLAYQPEGYEIHPGDILQVSIPDHPELGGGSSSAGAGAGGQQAASASGGRMVQPDGTFYFPYAGKVKAAGKTVEQVRSALTSSLSRMLKDPQVDVSVVGFGSSVTLQGAFQDASPQDITMRPLTLGEAVGRAGIDAEQADLSGLTLIRDGKRYTLDQDALNRAEGASGAIYLKPGDRIFMPYNEGKQIYVVGEVVRPQALTFRNAHMTLTQALGNAGGVDPATSNASAIYVIRGSGNLQQTPGKVFHLNAKSPVAFALGSQFMLDPGDVVFVGPAGITRWNRFLSQLLPFSGILRNAAAVQFNNN